ncbi:MAG: response regulator [Chloroflexota bacterium]|nr:response regulator [Chloroflexota bacterium]
MNGQTREACPAARRTPVVAVDQSPAVRSGIRAVLEASGHFLLVGEAAGVRSAARPWGLRQGLIVMDALIASSEGFHVLRQVKEGNPHAALLLLGEWAPDEEGERVSQAIAFGANGYLRKDCCATLLVGAALTVVHGAIVVAPGAAPHLLNPEALLGTLRPTPSGLNGATTHLSPVTASAHRC